MISLEFLITALVIVLVPGAGVVFTVAVGLGHGRRASFVAATACTLGILPHLAASLLGVAALLHTSAVLFQIVKFAGAGYLIYLAIQTLRDRGPLRFEPDSTERSAAGIMRSAILINLLNPKLSIFFLAFLPQFAPPGEEGALMHMLVLAGIFMGLTFVVFAFYGQCAGLVRDRLLASARAMAWLRRGIGLTLGAIGARLALSHA